MHACMHTARVHAKVCVREREETAGTSRSGFHVNKYRSILESALCAAICMALQPFSFAATSSCALISSSLFGGRREGDERWMEEGKESEWGQDQNECGSQREARERRCVRQIVRVPPRQQGVASRAGAHAHTRGHMLRQGEGRPFNIHQRACLNSIDEVVVLLPQKSSLNIQQSLLPCLFYHHSRSPGTIRRPGPWIV